MTDISGLGEPLYTPPNAVIDIVFVHGLGGHRINSWTFQPTDEFPKKIFWPKDLLPKVCNNARILSFGYDSRFVDFFPIFSRKTLPVGTTVDDHGSALLQSLAGLRSTTSSSDRPIIFIAHSLGGLVVASALARNHGVKESGKQLVDSTFGIVFLGTPFEGSAKAGWGRAALRYVSLVASTKKDGVKDLEERSQKLIEINSAFSKLLKDRDRDRMRQPLEVACFFEEYPTFVAGKDIGIIVPKSSAGSLAGIDPVPISANHAGLSKFAGTFTNGYVMVSKLIVEWINSLGDALTETTGAVKSSPV
ncbi:uncharacterized protein N0V89_001933 [Didymosphaeria variabile]|uniref:AB hydrolase-1 domain-containing protein n=1 Tax=Didymosphaeria variabile TaxID=1932322 RepID=A0A9W8XSJ6_9PLEO|nr:uncharacterized protein N0V89_001933 [Didymosphaeria variabile]KAJ4357358.1 hypothetical protein N0V89_001933 [Didymosphaeria variabile]